MDGFLIGWQSRRKLVSGDTAVYLWHMVAPTWKWSHPHSWRGWAECCFWNLRLYPKEWCSFVFLPMTVIGASWGLSWTLSWVISSSPCQRTVAPGTFDLDSHYGFDLNWPPKAVLKSWFPTDSDVGAFRGKAWLKEASSLDYSFEKGGYWGSNLFKFFLSLLTEIKE